MNPWLAKQLVAFSDKKSLSMMIMFVGSLTFVGWTSFDKFGEMYSRQGSMETIMDLEHEISQLRVQYRNAHPEDLQTEVEQAENHLLQDFTHLAQWAQDLQEQGDGIALQMHYQILKMQQTPSSIQGISIIPLELHIQPHNNRSGYRPFLQFLHILEQSGPRINIQEISVRGDGEKATNFTIGLSTWMKTQNSVEL